MFTNSMLSFCLVAALFVVCQSSPVPDDNGRSGSQESLGRYHHMPIPYRHVSDQRELGIYHHIPNPYDGGYGPYAGLNIPYVHDDRPYNHDLYTVSNAEFNVPEIPLEYGFPDHEPHHQPSTQY
ncbi:uncharacterized protein LOC122614208 isoform X1 [Drosophila teissieri]|uniref:uncharacterized protein LOC122614208 isoform X1 n=1 Tax=Drosophila teissieri TaxID=7243 RepID=UPI001CB9E977|nr:uncharacterized protein LOC122614208 isoform X1 [Drosophila teissieri]